MVTLRNINEFLNQKKFAIIGVSKTANKFGNNLYKEVQKKGLNIVPVHPSLDNLNGIKCFSSLKEIDDLDSLIISVKPQSAINAIKDAINNGIKHIWLQQGSESPEAIEICKKNEINVIYKRCLLMFINGDEMPHKIHRFFSKLFGKYPK